MCRAQSGVAVLVAEGEVKVYTLPDGDSHEDIRKLHNIRDDGGPGAQRQTPIELLPVRGVESPDQMDFAFDAERPSWWTEAMTGQATAQLFAAWRARWKGKRLSAGGYLDLRALTSLPAGVKLSAGGGLDLGALTSLPAGAKLSAGGYLDLRALIRLPLGKTRASIQAAARRRWQKERRLSGRERKAT